MSEVNKKISKIFQDYDQKKITYEEMIVKLDELNEKLLNKKVEK